MLPRNTDTQWELYGKKCPYFGVISKNQYKQDCLDESSLDEFFASGAQHIETVVSFINDHITKDFKPKRCLDFGCGVGRLVIPLAQRYPSVVGVDVSRSMLCEAQANCYNRSLDNVVFVESDDNLSGLSGGFDFIHSFIVFQHMNPKRGEKVLQRMLELLNPDGVAAIHLTYTFAGQETWAQKALLWMEENLPLIHNIANLKRRQDLFAPLMTMNHYNLNRIFHLLQDNKHHDIFIKLSNHRQHLGVMLFFCKRVEQLF